jgi:hypothetical protein
VNRIDELCVALMPPRSKVSLLSVSCPPPCSEETQRLSAFSNKLVDGAFDDDETFILERKLEAAFHMIVALTLNKYTQGF